MTLKLPWPEAKARYQKVLVARQARFDWAEWTKQLIESIDNNDLNSAASMLVGCTYDSQFTPTDLAAYRTMFRHPTVLAHAKALWAEMEPMFLEEWRDEHREEVLGHGWQI